MKYNHLYVLEVCDFVYESVIFNLQACKYALRQAGPLLEAERINSMLQEHLIDAGNLQYTDFMTDLVKKMVMKF